MKIEATNPFTPVPAGDKYFVGRKRELRKMTELLKNTAGGQADNIYVVGEGGIGKTSLIFMVEKKCEQMRLMSAYLVANAENTSADLLQRILRKILDVLQEKNGQEIDLILEDFENGISGGKSNFFRFPLAFLTEKIDSDVIEHDLKFILKKTEKTHFNGIVLFIDDAQYLKDIDGAVLQKLRGAIQAIGKGYMIVLSSTEDIIPSISQKYSGVDRFFPNKIILEMFESDEEAMDAIGKRLSDTPITFSEEVMLYVVRINRKHPQKIIIMCHDIFEAAKDNECREVDRRILDEVVFSSISMKEEISKILETTDSLDQNVKWTLQEFLKMGGEGQLEMLLKSIYKENDPVISRILRAKLEEELEILCSKHILEMKKSSTVVKYKMKSSLWKYVLENQFGIV
jgi:Cdc6-like AAA superfamily ATPase